ncbi:MAG: hypothetical protein NC548_06505 [Lachnospiraceae bacterium]|nr:hypothetical protein [Lachnospiraceae bacterium]
MAKERGSFGKRLLGAFVETPDGEPSLTPEQLAALTETEQPEVPVDASQISGDAVIESVYAQGNFQQETSLFRLQDFIASFPKELPTVTKQQSIAGILVATKISINDLIADGEQRVALLESAAKALKADNQQRETERNAEIEDLKQAIQEAQRLIAEDKRATDDSCDAIEKELESVQELLTFATGVANPNVGG